MRCLFITTLNIFLTVFLSAAPATQPTTAPASQPALGSMENPVRCDMPRGETAYLRRLRDKAGKRPTLERLGSFGTGPSGNILDGYELKSSDGTVITVYMDMYFPGYVEKQPIPGFTLVAP